VLIRREVVRRDASALMIVSTGRGIPAENFTLEPAAIPQQLHPNRSLWNLSSDLCMRWLMLVTVGTETSKTPNQPTRRAALLAIVG
jgi:hypothetical protein